ncbi:hypothetical protein HKX48_000640, partial [Thoreauomyces humboldtii]
ARLASHGSSRRPTPPPRRPPRHHPVNPAPASLVPAPTIESLVPVRLPTRDRPDATLTVASGAHSVLAHPALVVTRQVEMMNVLLGYEQGNKYAVKNSAGEDVGFIAEEEQSFSGAISRQLLRTRRPFKADILDRHGNVVLKIDRPLKWFLNSQMFIRDPNGVLIGEVKQVWHLWRRKYDIFWKQQQIAFIDAGFWAWDFHIQNEDGELLSAVNRNFVGFAREIFTDTGAYAIHYDDVATEMPGAVPSKALSLDERAVLLAQAISVDIDYFSRHSNHAGGFMPFGMFGMGGNSETSSDVPAAPGVGGAGDVIPSSGGVGGGVGPGVFGVFGGGMMGGSEGGGAPGSGAPSHVPPPPMAQDTNPDTNAWGETPFVSDEDAGGDGGGIGGFFSGFFDDD